MLTEVRKNLSFICILDFYASFWLVTCKRSLRLRRAGPCAIQEDQELQAQLELKRRETAALEARIKARAEARERAKELEGIRRRKYGTRKLLDIVVISSVVALPSRQVLNHLILLSRENLE